MIFGLRWLVLLFTERNFFILKLLFALDLFSNDHHTSQCQSSKEDIWYTLSYVILWLSFPVGGHEDLTIKMLRF